MLLGHLSGFKVFVNNWTNGNYLFWNFPTYFLLISFKITTFLLLLSSNIGKVAELWTLVYGWIVNTIRCSQSCIKQLVFTLYIKCALRQYYIIYNIQHCINTNYIYIFIKCSVSLDIFILSVCSTSQTDLYICHIFQPFALTISVASHLSCLIFIS